MELILQVVPLVFSLESILATTIGTIVGVIFGAIPGLSGAVGIAILLPITYGMSGVSALLMVGGIYMGGTYGGSISAILLNTPGSGAAAATTLDGYPMTEQGRGKEALYYAVLSSAIGGVVGILALIYLGPALGRFALRFGPPEMFLVALAGLTVVGSLSTGSTLKSVFAVLFGVFLSMIGPDSISGRLRLTFGLRYLRGGVGLIPVIIGFFAIAEMLRQASLLHQSKTEARSALSKASALEVFKDILRRPYLLVSSCVIGTFIGILPGTGGAVASFVAYGEAKRTSKSPQTFGMGNPEGIIAAETANNASVGGSLIPLLALGIPGSATAAVIYGALTIHGIRPGASFFNDTPEIAYTFMVGMLLTVLVMGLVGVYGVRLFALVLKVKMEYVIPAVFAFSIIGAYSARNSVPDVIIALACGLVGLVFRKVNIPTAPVVLGLILGNLTETRFRHSLDIARAQNVHVLQYIFQRPLALGLVVLVVLLVIANVRSLRTGKQAKA